MENYPNQELKAMPQPKPYHPMTDKELSQILNINFNYNILIPTLIENNRRKDKSIANCIDSHYERYCNELEKTLNI